MITFFKRLWQRRWVRGILWTLITVATLLSLAGAWVNWKGARAWAAAKQQIEAEGLTLDFRKSLREPIPDEENFCATPLLEGISLVEDGDLEKGEPAARRKVLKSLGLPEVPKGTDGRTSAIAKEKPGLHREPGASLKDHMRAWVEWLRKVRGTMPGEVSEEGPGKEVLAFLSSQDAIVGQLAARLDKPRAQLQPAGTLPESGFLYSISMPHLSPLLAAGQGLSLRAVAAAQSGEWKKAHEAARILARLAEAVSNDPFLISTLVSQTLCSYSLEVVRVLCEEHAGGAEDFAILRRDLARLNFRESLLHAWKTELTTGVDAIFYLKRGRDAQLLMAVDPFLKREQVGWRSLVLSLLPSGLFELNAAHMVQMELNYIICPLRDEGWQGVRMKSAELESLILQAKTNWYLHPDKIASALVIPSGSTIISHSLYCQNRLNQAQIACDLEEYFAEHRTYPDTLNWKIVSGGAPHPDDAISGTPMKYRRAGVAEYRLWSVGYDMVDDMGRDEGAPSQKRARPRDRDYKGDWVWQIGQTTGAMSDGAK